jgi:hypothetical protein
MGGKGGAYLKKKGCVTADPHQDALLREKQSINLLRQLVVQSTQVRWSNNFCFQLYLNLLGEKANA